MEELPAEGMTVEVPLGAVLPLVPGMSSGAVVAFSVGISVIMGVTTGAADFVSTGIFVGEAVFLSLSLPQPVKTRADTRANTKIYLIFFKAKPPFGVYYLQKIRIYSLKNIPEIKGTGKFAIQALAFFIFFDYLNTFVFAFGAE